MFLAPHHATTTSYGPPSPPKHGAKKPPPECFIETPCTRSCGDGFKLLLPNPNGYGCYGASLQVHPCNDKPCPIDCHWGSWSPWTQCTKQGRKKREVPAYGTHTSICTQARQRIVEVPAAHYGKECKGEYAESRFCQSYECQGKSKLCLP